MLAQQKLKLYTLKLYKQVTIHKLHTHFNFVLVYGTNSFEEERRR
jgi:hypothetical protein